MKILSRQIVFITEMMPAYGINSYIDFDQLKLKYGLKKIEVQVKRDILDIGWILEEDSLIRNAYAVIAFQPLNQIRGDIYEYEKRISYVIELLNQSYPRMGTMKFFHTPQISVLNQVCLRIGKHQGRAPSAEDAGKSHRVTSSLYLFNKLLTLETMHRGILQALLQLFSTKDEREQSETFWK